MALYVKVVAFCHTILSEIIKKLNEAVKEGFFYVCATYYHVSMCAAFAVRTTSKQGSISFHTLKMVVNGTI